MTTNSVTTTTTVSWTKGILAKPADLNPPKDPLDKFKDGLEEIGDGLKKIADGIGDGIEDLLGLGGKREGFEVPDPREVWGPLPSPFGSPWDKPLAKESGPLSRGEGLFDRALEFVSSGERSVEDKPIAGTGRIWGDPHFIGADGGKYDVQGEAGKTYNLLSDKGFQMNGKFEAFNGSDTATVVGKLGLTAEGNFIEIDKSGQTYVNGQELKDGERIDLEGGGIIEKDGANISYKKGEWEIAVQSQGDHLNIDATTTNAVSDGVKPHGLLGQTFDGDGKARNGDEGSGAQGGGAIEETVGDISDAGDKDAVKNYEVSELWDINFSRFNRTTGEDTFGFDRAASSQGDRGLAALAGATLFTSLFAQSAFSAGFGAGLGAGLGYNQVRWA